MVERQVVAASRDQRRIWFVCQLEGDAPLFNVPYRLRLAGALRPDVLRAAVRAIVSRHEPLRTAFAVEDGAPVQVVSGQVELDVPLVDLTGLPEAERAPEAERLADAEARRPFDLSCAPLLRAVLFRLAPDCHDLVFVTHHLVFDGWSLGLLLDELDQLYTAFAAGGPSPLPEPPMRYRDFVAWERERQEGEALARQLGYWRERLAGCPTTLDLPTDRPRPAIPSVAGDRASLRLDPALGPALTALGRQTRCSLFMIVMAAFQALLHRYSGHRDLLVGVPFANRPLTGTEGLVGLFVNVLPLRADLSGRPTFRELLGRVRASALGAYANQEAPFERLVAELRPERVEGHAPVLQVDLSMQQAPARPMARSGLEGRAVELTNGCALSELGLNVAPDADGTLRASVSYRTALWDADTIDRLLGHLGALLACAAGDPDRPVADLQLLTEGERRELAEWNATEAEHPRDAGVHRLVEARAARAPASLALRGAGVELTYAELNQRANRLARLLRGLGVGPEVLVAVCAERGPELVTGMLAVLKAGGAYVPLDPEWPRPRLAAVLRDAGAAVALTQTALAARLPRLPRVICTDDPRETAGLDAADLEGGAGARNLAYVVYTSGSTGQPRGVQVERASLRNLVAWGSSALLGGIRPGDRSSLIANPAFDAVADEIWPQLVAGASIHVPDQETVLSPARLLRWLADERITVSILPTALAARVLELDAGLPPSLRALGCGGDRLHRIDRDLPIPLHNLYGPTEATVDATAGAVRAREEPAIGRPIANVGVHVLDAGLQQLPVGVRGELCIGGDGVARGYLGRPDLTAERFVPDPFATSPGGRLYRTGDQARRRADGELEFLGRLDHQVKVRGFRIEPGEVEAALLSHPDVAEAVVVAREGGRGDVRLAAYVVAAGPEPLEAARLRAHLAETLPDYMRPAAIVPLPELPLTASGKIDRAALPDPPAPGPADERGSSQRTALERVVARVWAEVLGIEEDAVGLEDSFFDLGGHSLLLVDVQERLLRELDRSLPMTTFFRHPTVRALAGHLAGTDGGAAGAAGRERALTRDASQRLERERRLARRQRRP